MLSHRHLCACKSARDPQRHHQDRTGQEEVLESLSSSAGHHESKPAGSYPGGEEQKKKN